MLKVSKAQARRYLLKKQLLADKPLSGAGAVAAVFENLRTVQYDPLNPCGRNPDLVLQARVDGYHPEDYYKWLYQEKRGIECYDKLLCIIPVADYPFTAHNRRYAREHPEVAAYLKKDKEHLSELLKFIAKSGPVSSADVDNKGKTAGSDWYGVSQTWGKVALETLWKTGQLVITGRKNGNKLYDLPKRAYGSKIDLEHRHIEAQHIKRRVSSVGLIKSRGASDAWLGIKPAEKRTDAISKLLGSGELIEIEIEGLKANYLVAAEDQESLKSKIDVSDSMRFIAPLDTLIWDRNLIEDLFGFRYRWEVYVPAKKRQYGYYVLPILYKDKFVGRIEPVFKDQKLVIKKIWKEPSVKWTAELDHALEAVIERFAVYLQAKDIKKPAKLIAK